MTDTQSQSVVASRDPQRASDRGSVLIFVIGILLLLAIVATAFLGTSRSDRTSTQQNAVNTQIDLLMDGVVNAAKGQIINDESVPGVSTAENFDALTYGNGISGTNDDWLAPRVPTTADLNSVFTASSFNTGVGLNGTWWPTITKPVLGDNTFESPYRATGYTGAVTYNIRERLAPTFVTINGQNYPALQANLGTVDAPVYQPLLAGDADGDGIADSGLFRIPVGDLAGVTYYGAVRIIDNSSAINLGTAVSKDYKYGGTGIGVVRSSTDLAGSFTSDIGLAEMLRSLNVAPTSPHFDNMSTSLPPPFAPTFREWNDFNTYRLNIGTSATTRRPSGVVGILAASKPNPWDETLTSATAAVGQRFDYQFVDIHDAISSQLGNRLGNPGNVRWTSATNAPPAKNPFVDSLSLVSRFTLMNSFEFDSTTPTNSSNKLYGALPYTLGFNPSDSLVVHSTPYTGTSSNTGIDHWFRNNFDYLAENRATPATFMNRRTILTGANAVSDEVGTSVLPPDWLYSAKSSQWPQIVPIIPTPPLIRDPSAYSPHVDINSGNTEPTLPMYVASLSGATGSAIAIDPKVPINQGRFEELFYGYFKTMAVGGFTGLADNFGTPYSSLFQQADAIRAGTGFNFNESAPIQNDRVYSADGFYYTDPYIGMRFDAGAPFAVRREILGQVSVINGLGGVAEQHPLRQLRSVLRAAHDRSAAVPPATPKWDINTPRLPADQVLILRSALAAANLEALRDSSRDQPSQNYNERLVAHDIPLTARINNLDTPVVAHVYGVRTQPYITEVYANSNNDIDTTGSPVNPQGYVAIKLYNPTPVGISLRYCRLVGLRRHIDTATITTPATTQYPYMQVLNLQTPTLPAAGGNTTDQIDLGTAVSNISGGLYQPYPYIIPPFGTLILENVGVAPVYADDATHRPASVGLGIPTTGVITPVVPTVNVAYVPGLQRVVFDREVVLMRPTNCTPPVLTTTPPQVMEYIPQDGVTAPLTVSRMVPLDSYDFTGLRVPNGGTVLRAGAWHYIREVNPAALWKWVYPGRYDADQSIISPATPLAVPRARQQGTMEAVGLDGLVGFIPGTDQDPWAETANLNNPTPPVLSLFADPAIATVARYPDVFTIQLRVPGWPSNDPSLHDYTAVGAVPNRFPFGGFRRLGDMLEAPFIGAYTIQTEADVVAGNDTFLEINPVTIDSALAEDTDIADNENFGAFDDGSQSREQIGRFVPLRPTYGGFGIGPPNGTPAELVKDNSAIAVWSVDNANAAAFNSDMVRYNDESPDPNTALSGPGTPNFNRYRWASRLFDHFTISAPHDDYQANYPTQPKWQPGLTYSLGDTVSYGHNVYVCLAAHTSTGDPPPTTELDPGTPADASGTTPVYAAGTNTTTWMGLPRNAVSNSGQNPGSRDDLIGARSFDYRINNDTFETPEGTQGLININTAPEEVLAMIPWLPPSKPADSFTFNFNGYPSGTPMLLDARVTRVSDGIDDNAQIAHAIVLYRDGNYINVNPTIATNNLNISGPSEIYAHGTPFTSIYDLYKVPIFRVVQTAILGDTTKGVRQYYGDYSPGGDAVDDNVRYDFEEQTLLMNRVSNLITTHSDTFTIYALVQGWKNVGSATPQLVAQRRAAFIVDRSAATAANKTLTTLSRVPTQ